MHLSPQHIHPAAAAADDDDKCTKDAFAVPKRSINENARVCS